MTTKDTIGLAYAAAATPPLGWLALGVAAGAVALRARRDPLGALGTAAALAAGAAVGVGAVAWRAATLTWAALGPRKGR